MEYTFNKNFINILKQCIGEKHLNYNIDTDTNYKLDYIIDIVLAISTIKPRNKYTLHSTLATYFNMLSWAPYSITKIKSIIKKQIIIANDNNLLNNYVVINHNYPIDIKELVVIV
jgi:hypothetical protein